MELVDFMLKSGIGEILRDKKVKNIVDYALGVEVGLDSNGRKNRVGILMESLVEEFVLETCNKMGATYLSQANAKKIKMHWGLDIKVDKSSRNLDFAIKYNEKIIFIESS
jgi:type II restriction enzyme